MQLQIRQMCYSKLIKRYKSNDSLHKKLSFLLRISLLNVSKSIETLNLLTFTQLLKKYLMKLLYFAL